MFIREVAVAFDAVITFVVEPTSVDAPGVKELLEFAIGGSDVERTTRSLAPYVMGVAKLAAAFIDGQLVGVVGFRQSFCSEASERTTVLHIATSPQFRHRGVGKHLVRWVQRQHVGVVIEAETDNAAVGFYRATGFEVESLGEVFVGVERFRCVLRAC